MFTALSDIRVVQGAQCNLKGRILALMDVISWNGVKMVLPNDLIESTLHSLNKTAMLSRVNLKENNTLKSWGFIYRIPNKTFLTPIFFLMILMV